MKPIFRVCCYGIPLTVDHIGVNVPWLIEGFYMQAHQDRNSSYDSSYLAWKRWEERKFGILKRSGRIYYDAEIKKTGLKKRGVLRVLEIGFGNGSFLTYAKQKGWDVVGVEISNDLVQTASRHGYDVVCAENLAKFSDSDFDLIVAFDVLEHIGQNDLPAFFDEVARVLKNNGVLFARFPNGDSPFGLMNQNGDLTHVTAIGSGKIRHLASMAGADVVYIGPEAQPLFDGNFGHFVNRSIARPTKWLINMFVNFVFLPRANVSFCAQNLVAAIRVNK